MSNIWFYLILIFGLFTISCKDKETKKSISINNYSPLNRSLQPYTKDIKFATEFLLQHQNSIQKILSGLDENDKAEVLSIVFPEIIRWNEFQDIIEISADKTLYVNGGKKVADFSIGAFQMKPSFIEDLENYVLLNKSLEEIKYIILNCETDRQNRKQRIMRLENFEWQLRYAYVYWSIANDKFNRIKFSNQIERIRFFSTAYNTGFMKSITEIKKWEEKKAFPNGLNYPSTQMPFSDFSIEFNKIYRTYFNN